MPDPDAIHSLIERLDRPRVWDAEPVFCFTADVDWASEDVLEVFFGRIDPLDLKPTIFVTHHSAVIADYKARGRIDRGIHPNFLPGSSHGEGFETVIETCMAFAPEATCFRSHRLFDVTDTSHLLVDRGMTHASNLATLLHRGIRPIAHESGLVRFPIFFEDGTHLVNGLSLDLEAYRARFLSPGIKIISTHPMDFVINTPAIRYMRGIKDALSREEYAGLSMAAIERYRNRDRGVGDLGLDIMALAKDHRIMSLGDLYAEAVSPD